MRRAALVIIATLTLATPACFGISVPLRSTQIPKQREFIRTQINDILSAPEYNRRFPQVKPEKGILDRINDALERFFGWLGRGLSVGGGVGHTISAILAWTVIAAFLALFVLTALKLSARLGTGHGPVERDRPAGYDLPSSSRLMAEAAKLAEAGDYHGAFLRAYLGSISHLDEANTLRFERSRTNWEYLRELQGNGNESLAEQLRPLTSDFDRKFYGHDECTRRDYERAVEAYNQVRQVAA